jgi:hypothetical protein
MEYLLYGAKSCIQTIMFKVNYVPSTTCTHGAKSLLRNGVHLNNFIFTPAQLSRVYGIGILFKTIKNKIIFVVSIWLILQQILVILVNKIKNIKLVNDSF